MPRQSSIGLEILKWAGRGVAILLVTLVFAFLVGEGPPNPWKASLSQNLQFVAFLILVPAGLLIGLRWELLGGAIATVALCVFYALEYAAVGRFPGGAFPLFVLPCALYLMHHLLSRHQSVR